MFKPNSLLIVICVLLLMLSAVSCTREKPTEPISVEQDKEELGIDDTTEGGGDSSGDSNYTDQELEDYALELLSEGIIQVEVIINDIAETINVSDWALYKTDRVLIAEEY